MKANGDNVHSIQDHVRFAGQDGNGMAKTSAGIHWHHRRMETMWYSSIWQVEELDYLETESYHACKAATLSALSS